MKDVVTQIHHSLKDNTNLDLDSVFNLCHAFVNFNKDMILEDRIKYIFQNYSLCEEGCSYNNINIETRTISCDCKIQGNLSTITSPLVFSSGRTSSFFDSNIGVSKCYNLVFSFNNKANNIGFIVFSILIISYIIFIIFYIKKGIKPVLDYLYKEMVIHGYLDKNAPKFFENKNLGNNKNERSSVLGLKKIKIKNQEEKCDDDIKSKISNKLKKKKRSKKKKKSKLFDHIILVSFFGLKIKN